MDTGRDAVFELSAGAAERYVLQQLRGRRDAMCVTVGDHVIANWPVSVSFSQDPRQGAVANVTAATADGPVTQPVRLSGFITTALLAGNADLQVLLDQFDSSVLDVDTRAVASGAVALGIDLTAGIRQDDTIWNRFGEDFLTWQGVAYDWGLYLDRHFLEDAFERRLAAIVGDVAATLGEGSRVDPPRVRWGNPVRVTADAEIEWWGVNPTAVVHVDVRLRLDEHKRLVVVLGNVNVDVTGFWSGVDVGPLSDWLDDMVRTSLLEAIERDFQPVPIDIELSPLARLRGEALRTAGDGLILYGSATILPPPAPSLAVRPDPIVLRPNAASLCGGPGATATFEPVTVELGNSGRGTLHVCRVELEGEGFTIVGASDPPFGGIGSGAGTVNVFRVPISYSGRGDNDAAGTLIVHSNDPAGPVQTFPIRAPGGGTAEYAYDPEPLEIRVANTRTGDYEDGFDSVSDCRPWRPRRRNREGAAGTITVTNVGNDVGAVCIATVNDFSGTFDVDPIRDHRLAPGESVGIGVRFYPSEVGAEYTAFVDISTPEGPHSVLVRARVDPGAQRRRLDLAGIGATVEHVFDLYADAICAPPPLQRCEVRGWMEPLPLHPVPLGRPGGPLPLEVDVVDVGRVPAGTRVDLAGDGGDILGWEELDGPRGRVDDAWVDEPGFKGNWCIARVAGLGAVTAAGVRAGFSSRLLEPAGAVGVPGRRGIAGAGGWLYVVGKGGVRIIDWRDGAKPNEAGHIDIDADGDVTLGRGVLGVVVGDEIVAYDVTDPRAPVRIGAVAAGAEVRRLVALPGRFVAATAQGITSCRYDGKVMEALGAVRMETGGVELTVVGTRVVALTRSGAALLGGAAGGPVEVLDGDAKLSSGTAVRAAGDRIHVSDGATTRVYATSRGTLRKVGERGWVTWRSRFVPDRDGALYEVDNRTVRRWRASRRRVDRARFPGAFERRLEGLPKRTGLREPASAGPENPSAL